MAGLRFGVLGPLEVWSDDRSVEVPSGRRRRVLAALLVRPGRPVSVDALIEAGWDDQLPADPRAALYTVVSRLRSVVGDQAIRAEPAGYLLDVADATIDSARFDGLCESARTAAPERASKLLDEALGLWRGAAYAEFPDLDVVNDEAHRLELLRTDAREERARLALELDDPRDAVRRLETLLADHPFREQAVELLMTALQSCGRTVEALECYRTHRERMVSELGLEPAPSLRALQHTLLRGTVADGASSGQPNGRQERALDVPSWLDTSATFVGRARDVERLVSAATSDRLVCVVGPGGVGKTRLVAQTLPTLASGVGLPVSIIELASVEPSGVDRAIAEALRLRPERDPRAALVRVLRAEPRLLVLDNCEHVLSSMTSLAEVLAGRCPGARMVLTSRHRLGLAAERVVAVAPLPVPAPADSLDQIRTCASVRLLVDRIERTRSGAAISEEALPSLAAISRRTDGLPLALELAASQCGVLGADVVAEHLARDPGSIDDLAAPDDDGDPRSVRGLVDRSCALLSPAEQRLFAAMSVFTGRYDLAAVEGLVRIAPELGSPSQVPGMLSALVDASLVAAEAQVGRARYRLLGVLHAQAGRRLARSGRGETIRRAHARWVAELTEEAAVDHTGPRCAAAFGRLDAYRDDLAAGLRWALAADDLELAARIAGSVQLCSHWSAQPDLTDTVIAVGERCADSAEPSALGLGAAAMARASRGDNDRATELARIALGRAIDTEARYLAQLASGVAALYAGRLEVARRSFTAIAETDHIALAYRADGHSSLALVARYHCQPEQAAEEGRLGMLLAETAGSGAAQAFACYAAGEAAPDPREAVRLLSRAVEEASAIAADQVSTVARVALMAALARSGRHRESVELAAPLIQDVRRSGSLPQFWTVVRVLAEIYAEAARPQEAALLLAAADTHPSAPPTMGQDVLRYARIRAELRARLGPRMADRIRTVAAAASPEQIAGRVLGALQPEQYDPEAMQVQIRFCTAPDGVRTAYATTPGGPGRPLVRAATWLTHLEADRPIYQHWLDSFGRDRPFVRYDLRGCGLSDRDLRDFSLSAKVSDLESVVDAVGADRVDLLGLSGGGPVAIAYAARHPERVAHLVLYGSFARGRGKRDHASAEAREEADLLVSLTRVGWGRPNPAFRRVFSTLFMPDAASEQLAAFEEMQRVSCSAATAARIRESSYDTDVSGLARALTVPTLVLHVRDDAVAPFEEGRHLAGMIPGARFVTLPGRNHIIGVSDPGWTVFVDTVKRFLATEPDRRRVDLEALTARELDVLSLVSEGLDNDQIAGRLMLSSRTVERHLSNVYAKLGVSGKSARAAAAAAFARRG